MADYSQLMNLEKQKKEPLPLPERKETEPVQAKKEVVSERPNDVTPERSTVRRIITRNSFEIYEDQMDSLRRLAYEEKMHGKQGSMSAMVRDAIDTFILHKASKK